MKKTWTKPELVMLVRGKAEEAILMACKVQGNPTGALTNEVGSDCLENLVFCSICSATTGS